MSGPMQAASLLPPLSRSTASTAAHDADMRTAAAEPAGAAPFELTRLRLLPRPQRDAALEAEETPVQPRLEVGPADDPYEREADEIADTVMRMPADAIATEDDDEGLRRRCAACEAEDTVQRQGVAEAEAETGPPSLAAAPAALTSGGAPLSRLTRTFYELRLGRDLSAVRVHDGAPARELSDRISARAFTYGSHIWLGEGATDRPSHTLSHEMAHVLQQTRPRALQLEAKPATAAAPAVQRQQAQWVPAVDDPGFWKPPSKATAKTHDTVVKEVSRVNPDIFANVPIPNAGTTKALFADTEIPINEGAADFYRARYNARALPGVTLAKNTDRTKPSVLPNEGNDEATEQPSASAPASEAAPPTDATDGGDAGVGGTPPADPTRRFGGLEIVNIDEDATSGRYLKGAWVEMDDPNRKVLSRGALHKVTNSMKPRVDVVADQAHLFDVGAAPGSIQLGELKPGHNVDERRKGAEDQLPRYKKGLERVSQAVNSVAVPTRGRSRWNLGDVKFMENASDLVVPHTLKPNSTDRTFQRDLVLHVEGLGTASRQDERYPGQLVFGHDPRRYGRTSQHRGVWTYTWVPKNQSLTAASLIQGDLAASAAALDELVRELTRAPTAVATQRKPGSSRPARRRVQRLPGARRKRTDPFPKKWEEDRRAFARTVDALVKADLRSPTGLQRAAAMEEAFEAIEEELEGYSAPKLPKAAATDLKLLRRMQRMAGPLGKLLGELRKRFGILFVKVATAYDGFRQKFDDRVNRTRGARVSGRLGGWRGAVFAVLLAAVTEALKLLAGDITRRFAQCLDGMSGRLLEQMKAELDAEIETEIEAFRSELMPVIAGFEEMRTRLERDLESWFKPLDDLDAFLDRFEDIQPLLDGIEVSVRALILAAGCSGAGVGCIAGALGQIAVGEFIEWGAGTDWFREAVIVPIVSSQVEPVGATLYADLVGRLLGAPNAETIRGRIRAYADGTPACALPGRQDIGGSSPWAGGFPAPKSEAERSKLAGEALARYAKGQADALMDTLGGQFHNPDGKPATADQLRMLAQIAETSGLNVQQLKSLFDSSRGPNGKVEVGTVLTALRGGGAAPGLPGATPGSGEQNPPITLETTIPPPGGPPGSQGRGPRMSIGPTTGPIGEGAPPAPGVGLKIEF